MRILCVYIGDQNGDEILYLTELSHTSYWTRSVYSDALKFATSLLCERTIQGHRQVVQNKEENTQITVQSFSQWAIGIVTDIEYPLSVCWRFIAQVSAILEKDISPSTQIKELFQKGQDPKEIDPILKVEHTLEEVKTIMHQNITDILKRGEQIQDLIDKSNKLEESSKKFLHKAKAQNRCCKAW